MTSHGYISWNLFFFKRKSFKRYFIVSIQILILQDRIRMAHNNNSNLASFRSQFEWNVHRENRTHFELHGNTEMECVGDLIRAAIVFVCGIGVCALQQ